MAAALLYLLMGRYSISRAMLFALGVIFIVMSVFALYEKRWAIAACVLIAVILMLRWLPVAVINTWMFISGHELYQDSPATILVVLSYAIVFAIPATILSTLYMFNRKSIWPLIRYGKSSSP